MASYGVGDPEPINDSTQTSVCDNRETNTFPIIHHAADPAAAQDHAPLLVPGSNVVLHPGVVGLTTAALTSPCHATSAVGQAAW